MNRLNLVKNFKAYTLRIKDRRKQNIALLKSYFRQQRTTIIKKTQKRMLKITLWTGIVSLSYYFAHKIYSQKLQVQQMQKKLKKLYPSIVTKVQTQNDKQIYYVKPQYDDQLTNIIEMCWKYHYKVIVKSDQIDKENLNKEIQQFIKDIPEKVTQKLLIISLSNLKNIQIDQINSTAKVQSGITLKQLNEKLLERGYQSIFIGQISQNVNQTVYDAITNNYPTQNNSISNIIVNLDMISPQGQYFRSSNQNNQYGATPNLNNIFIGTEGVFGIPIRSKFTITPNKAERIKSKNFVIQCDDLNQKLLITRKIKDFFKKYQNFVSLELSNKQNNLYVKLQTSEPNNEIINSIINQIKKQITDLKQFQSMTNKQPYKYSIFFNSNQIGFEKFLIFKQKHFNKSVDFCFSKNLLKVNCQDNSILLQMISELSSQNTVLVWAKDKKFIRQIKKTIDQSQVGSELMKILVQIREGIDHKKIYYSHNRYEEYFAKGTFRKLTQIFW